jgi:hypothetical protein
LLKLPLIVHLGDEKQLFVSFYRIIQSLVVKNINLPGLRFIVLLSTKSRYGEIKQQDPKSVEVWNAGNKIFEESVLHSGTQNVL